jgi:hypothetical protein
LGDAEGARALALAGCWRGRDPAAAAAAAAAAAGAGAGSPATLFCDAFFVVVVAVATEEEEALVATEDPDLPDRPPVSAAGSLFRLLPRRGTDLDMPPAVVACCPVDLASSVALDVLLASTEDVRADEGGGLASSEEPFRSVLDVADAALAALDD